MNKIEILTSAQVFFVNKLNQLLKQKQQKIIQKGIDELKNYNLESPYTDIDIKVFNVHVDINCYLKKGDWIIRNHIWELQYNIDTKLFYVSLYIDNRQRFMGLVIFNEGWISKFMPALDGLYCYLLYDLIDYSGLGNRIFDIETIVLDVSVREQERLEIDKM